MVLVRLARLGLLWLARLARRRPRTPRPVTPLAQPAPARIRRPAPRAPARCPSSASASPMMPSSANLRPRSRSTRAESEATEESGFRGDEPWEPDSSRKSSSGVAKLLGCDSPGVRNGRRLLRRCRHLRGADTSGVPTPSHQLSQAGLPTSQLPPSTPLTLDSSRPNSDMDWVLFLISPR